jgi:hypothetical protein
MGFRQPDRSRRVIMTHHARRAAAAALCALAAAAASPASAAHLRTITERIFPFQPGGTIDIESQNGRIVVDTWERQEVRVQITREVRASDDAHERALMRQLTADVQVEPRGIRIRSIYPKHEKVVGIWDLLGHGVRSANIHYYLQVPRETSLHLTTANGVVRVRGTQGTLVANTTNGDIDVSAVRGSVEAHTTNGEVRIAKVEGPVNAGTTNGSIAAEMTALPQRGEMNVETTNGNIALTLPTDLHATVEANTTNGRVNINYKVTMRGMITSKRVHGEIGGGGPRIHLETTNGNIDVGPPRARASH